MSSNDVDLRTRAEPVAAPVSDTRFGAVVSRGVVGAPATPPRFTRRGLIVSFVFFNVVVWSALIWWLLR